MIKTITEFRSKGADIEHIIRMRAACNWRGNLTQEEIRQSARECRQVHKVTAW